MLYSLDEAIERTRRNAMQPSVKYLGRYPGMWPGIVEVETRDLDYWQVSALPPRNDLYNHSPDGFAWGYGGSGPAQLALAILAHHLRDDARAVRLHQPFKFAVIARLPEGDFTLTSLEVADAVRQIEAERRGLA